jgi:5-keto 4-deoxyuronate isomerase
VLSEGAIGFITKFILNKESAIYLGTYGNRNILFEAMKAVLESKEYINSLLFNHNGYIKKSITTKAIINKKLFFKSMLNLILKQDQNLYTIALLMAL